MKKLTAVVLGYGARGARYAEYALANPDELEIVAVADPLRNKCETAMRLYGIPEDRVFTKWEDLAALPKMADFAIIGTQDNMHCAPALAMIEKGYDLLLEKPMAPTAKECKLIAEAAEKKGVRVVVCHVLRFTNFWYGVKEMLDSGVIGDVRSIIHMENIGNEHFSHSYVRGNWGNTAKSSPMILAKSCHDVDLLQWLLDKPCLKVQSFGSLEYFTAANRPEGAPDYCLQGCPVGDTCCYNARKLYYEADETHWFRRVAAKSIDFPTDEQVLEAIKDGPYGRCVFACDNDVADHQVVNMLFEGGCTASFTVNAFNEGGRHIRLFGTEGEMIGDMDACTMKVYSYNTKEWTEYHTEQVGHTIADGHGGGDKGIVRDTVRFFNGESSKSICDVHTSYMNHLIAFAAEESRLTDQVIDLEQFAEEI